MNVFIVTAGSRGDVQPFIALGQGLKQAGHTVTLCTCSSFKTFITEHGLNYGYMNNDFIKLVGSETGRKAIEGGKNAFSLIKTSLTLLKESKALNRDMLEDAWNAAQAVQPDIIIFHPKVLAGSHIAEKLGIPAIMALLVPAIVPTAEFVATGFPNLKLGAKYNQLSYGIVRRGYRMYDDVVNEFRQTTLDLSPVPKDQNPLQMSNGKPISVIHGYSKHISPRPNDWPRTAHTTGYWFLEHREDYQPPSDLVDFLAAGEAPIYVGFGSMAGRNPERITSAVIEAIQQSGVRGIIATGWGGLKAAHLPETIFKLEHVSHDWLFPQVSAVIHHGGAGTTAAGLRASKPTIICPFLIDQPYWGERIYSLGAGSKPIPQKNLTATKLAAAIRKVTTESSIQETAERISSKLNSEDGIGNAISIIENHL